VLLNEPLLVERGVVKTNVSAVTCSGFASRRTATT